MYVKMLAFTLFVCQMISNGLSFSVASYDLVTATMQIPTVIPIIAIPLDYVIFSEDQAAYKIHEEPATWDEARDRCISEYARLAIADSREKIEHINSLRNKSEPWLYVGIHYSASANQWVGVDNGLHVTSIPWDSGEPDGTGNCAGIPLNVNGLRDYPCGERKEHFVCEIPM